jgi:HEAT repeat protein
MKNIWYLVAVLLFAVLLQSCKESADVAVPALVADLGSQDSGERNRAALRLASYGKDAAPAVRSLIRLLGDDNSGVRSSAAYALRQIDTPEARKALDGYRK